MGNSSSKNKQKITVVSEEAAASVPVKNEVAPTAQSAPVVAT
jgi:hypothetical protein